jgi:hypothetical protein
MTQQEKLAIVLEYLQERIAVPFTQETRYGDWDLDFAFNSGKGEMIVQLIAEVKTQITDPNCQHK